MPCYKPLTGWLSRVVNPSGKRSVVFKFSQGLEDTKTQIPCGRCIGCRLERSRQWAVRCVHEASLYDNNCFITLTFNNNNLDSKGSLVKADFQKFMKRLRKRFGSGVRYFHCGEYGSNFDRPHHHACLFNFDFNDKVLWSVRQGVRLYTSVALSELWPFGFSTVGEVTFESAAYVARYVMKKITGKKAESHYAGRVPEYVTMSRRPGIATGWLKKFCSDVYPHDYLVIRGGIKCKPPRFYDNIFDLTNHNDFRIIRANREIKAINNPDNRQHRLNVRGDVKAAIIPQLRRSYESESV